jgi:hypothetical protein
MKLNLSRGTMCIAIKVTLLEINMEQHHFLGVIEAFFSHAAA